MYYCGKEVIRMPLYKIIEIRWHKKKRINKKLNKRYGIRTRLIQIRPKQTDAYVAFDKIFIPEEIWDKFIGAIKTV